MRSISNDNMSWSIYCCIILLELYTNMKKTSINFRCAFSTQTASMTKQTSTSQKMRKKSQTTSNREHTRVRTKKIKRKKRMNSRRMWARRVSSMILMKRKMNKKFSDILLDFDIKINLVSRSLCFFFSAISALMLVLQFKVLVNQFCLC